MFCRKPYGCHSERSDSEVKNLVFRSSAQMLRYAQHDQIQVFYRANSVNRIKKQENFKFFILLSVDYCILCSIFMSKRNIKLVIQYDGSDYHGWQIQPGKKTIQEAVTEAIRNLVGKEVVLTGASRTDAGVSALGQSVFFELLDSPIPTVNLAKAITDRLPEDIAVIEAAEVSPDFDVISDVKNKLYRYTIYTGKVRPVLQIRHCWHLPYKLDAAAMDRGAKMLVGKKDFKSFASAADQREDSVRTIFRCDITQDRELVYTEVEGDGFLYNMVRNIVGTLAEVGIGRMKPEKIAEIIDAKDRCAAGPMAPPEGLCLMEIKY
jgi:tRNA pseudouridine38-40 synthase